MRQAASTVFTRSSLEKFRWLHPHHELPVFSLLVAIRKIFISIFLARPKGDLNMESWHRLEYRGEREEERDPRLIDPHRGIRGA